MYELHCNTFIGQGDMLLAGEYNTYTEVIDALLDIRNNLRPIGEGEFNILKDDLIIQRFILGKDGLKEVQLV